MNVPRAPPGQEQPASTALLEESTTLSIESVNVPRAPDGMDTHAQLPRTVLEANNGMFLPSTVNVQPILSGMAHNVSEFKSAQEVHNLTLSPINVSVLKEPLQSMESVNQLDAQVARSGLEPIVLVKLVTTGMELTVSSASMVKFGTPFQRLVFVPRTTLGTETSVKETTTVQVAEFSIETIKFASALTTSTGMETLA